MTAREATGRGCHVADFVLDVADLRPGVSILVVGDADVADVVAARVGPLARAATLADLPRAEFDCIVTVRVPELRSAQGARTSALADRLRAGGQLWVVDEAAPGESTGPRSMSVSAALSRGGFVIVDMLERAPLVGVLAAAG